MHKPKEPLTENQITDAKQLCELIKSVPEKKQSIFEIIILAYMNGMEEGIIYAQELSKK